MLSPLLGHQRDSSPTNTVPSLQPRSCVAPTGPAQLPTSTRPAPQSDKTTHSHQFPLGSTRASRPVCNGHTELLGKPPRQATTLETPKDGGFTRQLPKLLSKLPRSCLGNPWAGHPAVRHQVWAVPALAWQGPLRWGPSHSSGQEVTGPLQTSPHASLLRCLRLMLWPQTLEMKGDSELVSQTSCTPRTRCLGCKAESPLLEPRARCSPEAVPHAWLSLSPPRLGGAEEGTHISMPTPASRAEIQAGCARPGCPPGALPSSPI